MTYRALLLIAACAVASALSGCGGSAKLAPVHGKLEFEGKPVTAGTILFAPKGKEEGQFEVGKPSTGAPDEKGEFQLSTYKKDDGALIGMHTVIYSAPEAPTTNDPEIRARDMEIYKQFKGLKLPENTMVEVKPGKNELVFKLIR